MQNCSDARAIMSGMGVMITESQGRKGETAIQQAANEMSAKYILKQCHVNDTEYGGMEVAKRNQLLNRALADALTQIYHLVNYGEQSKE